MNIKYLTLTLLAVFAMASQVRVVQAAEDDFTASQEQECRQIVETECEAGAYGQVSSCKAKAEQVCKQKQKIVVKDKVLGVAHEPVDTALDLQASVATTMVLAAGAGSLALKKKLK